MKKKIFIQKREASNSSSNTKAKIKQSKNHRGISKISVFFSRLYKLKILFVSVFYSKNKKCFLFQICFFL